MRNIIFGFVAAFSIVACSSYDVPPAVAPPVPQAIQSIKTNDDPSLTITIYSKVYINKNYHWYNGSVVSIIHVYKGDMYGVHYDNTSIEHDETVSKEHIHVLTQQDTSETNDQEDQVADNSSSEKKVKHEEVRYVETKRIENKHNEESKREPAKTIHQSVNHAGNRQAPSRRK